MDQKIKQLIREAFHPKEYYDQFGTEVLDELVIDKYSLIIFRVMEPFSSMMKQMHLPIYQLGMEKEGLDFTNIEHQLQKFRVEDKVEYFKIVRAMKNKLSEWVEKYGDLAVGSYSERKMERYQSLLEKLGFTCQKKKTLNTIGIDIFVVSR